ncbi:MAG: hypothetical protein V2I27_02610 [Erythrobacter sp.]|jgi:hypothetical protein|nr:hypothetical protein [Erythrobacter sp.]
MTSINQKLTHSFNGLSWLRRASLGLLAGAIVLPQAAHAQAAREPAQAPAQRAPGGATYADLVTLAEASGMVVRAQIRRQTEVAPERAPGLAPGHARLYVQAQTQALISGRSAVGEDLVYLIDLPRDAKGKPPRLKDRTVLLFANNAGLGPKGATQLQLAGNNAQLEYSPALETRLRPILSELVAGDPPPVITGIKDALAVPGTLAGESETQIFLETRSGAPVSITVLRRPSQEPVWGVSWGEIIDSSASAPQRETLRWYRLACALPDELPSSANLSREADVRALAARDYAFVRSQLGQCARALT